MMVFARVRCLAFVRVAIPAPPAPPLIPVEAIKKALVRAERLVPKPPVRAKVVPLRAKPVPPPPPPESSERLLELSEEISPTRRDEELLLQEINGCKTLLLEVIRRAAYDWVLYRASRRMVQKVLAEQAYRWLFTEIPGSADWKEREREGKHISSFISICESLDLDPDTVRRHIKRLTPKNVMSVGRPAEYRRRDVFSSEGGGAEAYSLPDGLVGYDDGPDTGVDDGSGY